MALDLKQIRKQIESNAKSAVISKAITNQNRIKFHVQKEIVPHVDQSLTDFLAFVRSLIPKDKFEIFKALIRYPLLTNAVTEECFNKLARIFEGQNPVYNYQFADSKKADDWALYRREVLREPSVWSMKGWEYFKTEINSVLVVDMPSEQDPADKYPQPYFYWLPISSVVTYDVDESTGVMQWLIFRHDDNIIVLDDERYRVFKDNKGNIGELLIDNPHDLGYCPARFFWNESLNLREPDIKCSPISQQLGALDWYLFFGISKKHLDTFGSYPILSGYEQSCNYQDHEGNRCEGGYLIKPSGESLLDKFGNPIPCPQCGDRAIAGAGSYITIPIPKDGEQADLRNPVQMLSVDRNSLDYNVAEEERLRRNIVESVVGTAEDITKDAINEKQVNANFESQGEILKRIKKGFEEAQRFVDETICRLRYGEDFLSAEINYGTEFFLYDATELRERYKTAEESGASESELDALQRQIIQSEYRNDATQMQRMLMLFDLEPYHHLTRREVIELNGKGIISDEDTKIKLNFASYIRRFERENTNILDFGNKVDYDKKINIILNELKSYANQI